MLKIKAIFLFFVMVAMSLPAMSQKKTMAIFITNETSMPELNNAKNRLEKILSAHVNNSGFGVISHDLVLRNLNAYLGNPNAKYKNIGESLKKSICREKSLDSELFENASGLRIADFIGAEYILSVSISSFGKKAIKTNSYGVKTKNTIYTLRCNYNLFESSEGIGMTGQTAVAKKSFRHSENLEVEIDTEFINELLDECAKQMASSVKESENDAVAAKKPKTLVFIEVNVPEMQLPQIIEDSNGNLAIKPAKTAASIEISDAVIDGVSCPVNNGETALSKGIHYLKIFHKDLLPIEKTINVNGESKQRFSFSASFSEDAKKRLKDDIMWMQNLSERMSEIKNKEKITDAHSYSIKKLSDAEALKAKGIYEMLKKSGYNIKIDAKNMPNTIIAPNLIGQ